MSRPDLEYYCELIAALKLRTTNNAGRHLSTGVQYSCLKSMAWKRCRACSGHLPVC